ncbi:MAG: hypothetical protein E7592_01620 [Ruminococcaceae bacterium]|nr:hypothetical protein [Oscillospiraceae bacterium]
MKRLAAIILSALILFSFTACDLFNDSPEESENSTSAESEESTTLDTDNTETYEYSFISQEEKSTWKPKLTAILSQSQIHELEQFTPGSVSVGLMDLNFDNSPEVLVTYAGGSMCNILIHIYDLNSGEKITEFHTGLWGGWGNIFLCVAEVNGDYVIVEQSSIRDPDLGYIKCVGLITKYTDIESEDLITQTWLTESESGYYKYNNRIVDKSEYDAHYQDFQNNYRQIGSTQIQMIHWSSIGQVEKHEPSIKSAETIYTREEIAEKMAEILVSTSQEFIDYNNSDNFTRKYKDIPTEYHDILDAYIEIANLNRYEGCIEYDDIPDDNYPNISADCLRAIKYSVIDSWHCAPNGYNLGYATKDINGDGTVELFLTDKDYKIYSLFTIVNDEVFVKYFYSNKFSYETSLPAIDADGNIYTSDYGKGDHWWYNILQLGADATLYGITFGHYDLTGFGDPDVYNYFSSSKWQQPDSVAQFPEIEGDRISDEELYELVSIFNETLKAKDPDGCGKPNHVTREAGLTFYEVIVHDKRK